MTELSGFKNSEEFFKDPSKEPPPQPEPEKPSPEEMQMQMMQMQVQLAKGQLELDQMRLKLDEDKAQTDAALKSVEIETDAQYLLEHTSVHGGDAQILAFTRDTDSILISCDKDLISAAISVGVSTINPDQLHTGNLEFQINKGRDRIAQTVEKISNQVKKPVKKITWELFTA